MLKQLDENQAFVLPDGSKIKTLPELVSSLKIMDDQFFSLHVNQGKNDFASWISTCFGDELLASRISKMQKKQEIAEEIEHRIEHAKLKEKIIPKPKEKNVPQVQEPVFEDLDTGLDAENQALSKEAASPAPEASQTPLQTPVGAAGGDDIDSSLDNALDISIETPKQEEVPRQDAQSQPSPDLSLDDSLANADEPSPAAEKEKILTEKIEKPIIEELKFKAELSQKKSELSETLPPVTKGIIDESVTPPSPPIRDEMQKAIAEPAFEQKITSIIEKAKEEIAAPKAKKAADIETAKEIINSAEQKTGALQAVPIEEPKKQEEALKDTKLPEVAALPQAPAAPQVSPAPQPALTDDEKRLLSTNNKELSPKDLFKKIKLQKRLATEKDQKPAVVIFEKEKDKQKEKEETGNAQAQTPEQAVDLLSISDDEFNRLIGVNPDDQFVATTSTDNIIKVKPRKHLKTGVPGFDELIEKGILEGSSVLVSGGPGSGKTTFCIQQLGWAAEHGEKCLFISLEEKEERLVEHMKGYGLNPEKYLKDGNLKIKKLDSFKLSRAVEALLAHARGELMIDIGPVLDIIPEGFKPDRVVLDSLSSIAAAFAGRPEEYRVYVEQLFNIFELTGATSFIITEIQGSEATGHGGIEDFLADGVINFYNMKKGTIRQPAVEVLKMRGVSHKKKIVPFGFISGKGLEIYPLEEVFHGD